MPRTRKTQTQTKPATQAKEPVRRRRTKSTKTTPVEEPAVEKVDVVEDQPKVEETQPTKKAPTKRAPTKRTTTRKAPAKKAPVKEETVEQNVESDSNESDQGDSKRKVRRVFKIVVDSIEPSVDPSDISNNGGRYTGTTPMQAGKKAFSNLARISKKDDCEFVFSIQETTKDSNKKTFNYVGKRKKLAKPQVVKRGGSEYKVRYETTVTSNRGRKTVEA